VQLGHTIPSTEPPPAMPTNYERDHLYATPSPSSTAQKGAGKGDDKPTVRTPGLDHQRLSIDWADVDCVRAGTRAMREMGEAYLPKEPGEGDEEYMRRLGRATLTPIYKRLVRAFASQVLRKPIKLANTGNLPEAEYRAIAGYHPGDGEDGEAVTGHIEDLDRMGSDLQQFAYDWLVEAIHYSHAVVEVSYPKADAIQTRADEVAAGLRPHWSLYPAPMVLGARGGQQLEQVRLLQRVTVPDGEWGEREIEQVLVYRLDEGAASYQIWRESDEDEGEWYVHEEGSLDMAGTPELPVSFLYSDRKGQATPPPMMEVLHLNIRHYQISADMDNSLHVAAVPRLFFFGCQPEDIGSVGSVGEAICLPNAESRAEWSAPNPAAFEPNYKRLESLKAEMMQLGLSIMASQKNVGESAEAKRLDRSQGDSQLAILAQNLQTAIDAALRQHCAYMGIDPANAPTCTVNRDFDLSAMDAQFLQALTGVVNAGKLSDETFFHLLQQGEIGLPDDWTPAAEIERLDAQFRQQTQRPDVPNGILGGDGEQQ
jgi:hypothetical protein